MTVAASLRLSFRRLFTFVLSAGLIVASVAFSSTPVKAASFQSRTGYYVGNGSSSTVTNIGFQPDLVIVKATTTASVAAYKTSAMPANTTAYFSATTVNTANQLTLTSTGFTTGTTLSTNNLIYQWVAFGGSDCSAAGTFCVGTYTGNGATTQTITTGFQPGIVMNKRSTSVGASFRTASMPANYGEYFLTTATNTAGTLFTSLNSDGFTVGSLNSTSGGVYYYAAFASSSSIQEGTYTGDGTDNRNIGGVGFTPSALFMKNTSSATSTNRRAVFSTTNHYGDQTSYSGEALAVTSNVIQGLRTDGFQVGSGIVNEANAKVYWFAFGDETATTPGNGSFSYDEGVYTGTGAAQTISGLSFTPDLIIVKDDAANLMVFRTKLMAGDLTAYFASGSAPFAGGITSMGTNSFTVGTNVAVNTAGNTYRWQAFGNAYNQATQSGASDFAIGAYYGNGTDNRNITKLPFSPDLLVIRSTSAAPSVFRTSLNSGDNSQFFAATTDLTNAIQSFSSDGFQVGTTANTNATSAVQWWFAFKAGANLKVGTYTGNGAASRTLPLTSYRPSYIWIKRVASATSATARPASIVDDTSQVFGNASNAPDVIKGLNGGGFTVGPTLNANAASYRYIAWRKPLPETLTTSIVTQDGTTVSSPVVDFSPFTTRFSCDVSSATLGTGVQRVRVANQRSSSGWATSIAATDGPSALWRSIDATSAYDFNDVTDNGCSSGSDGDGLAGSLRVEASSATITPEAFCSASNVTSGADQSFSQGVNAVPLASAAIGADTGCYWDITNITLRQTIPLEQLPNTYTLPLTITTVAL